MPSSSKSKISTKANRQNPYWKWRE